MEIVTLREAKEKGLSFYFTGEPCKHGHVCKRKTVNRACYDCFMAGKKIRDAKRYADPVLREQEKARVTAWNKANPERYRKRLKEWRANNKERQVENIKRWIKENPERYAEIERIKSKRRNLRKRSNGGTFTQADIDALFARHKGKCGNCGVKGKRLHIDHIKSVKEGGTCDPSNLQLLCQPCNSRKGAKDPIVWAQENGRLL